MFPVAGTHLIYYTNLKSYYRLNKMIWGRLSINYLRMIYRTA